MNEKYRMYVVNTAIKFQKEAEVYRHTDREICRFASAMAAKCYEELARINMEEQ